MDSSPDGKPVFVAYSVTWCPRQQMLIEVLFEGLPAMLSQAGKAAEKDAIEKAAETICLSVEIQTIRSMPNQMVSCQGAVTTAHRGSNGARVRRTPQQIISSFRMQAPTAAIRGLPAAINRSKNSLRTGLNRIAVRVGR
jgi:hypothetical protein